MKSFYFSPFSPFQQSSAKRPRFKTISIKLFSFSLLFFLYIITLTVRTASKVQTSWLLNCWWLWTMESRPVYITEDFFFGLHSQNMRFCFIMHNGNVLFLVNKYYVSSPIYNLSVSLFVVGLSITIDISSLGFEVFFYGFGFLMLLILDQQYSFLKCMCMLSGNGCFWTFCTLVYCLIPKKVPNELMGLNTTISISVVSNWNPVYLV